MECADPHLLEQWTAAWNDLVEFEVIPVMTSEQAAVRQLGIPIESQRQ
jgi:hypothetical protein